MRKWQDYFKIVKTDEYGEPMREDDWVWGNDVRYQIQDPAGKVIGTYKDETYAKKQARYKFKRILAKLEKILLA